MAQADGDFDHEPYNEEGKPSGITVHIWWKVEGGAWSETWLFFKWFGIAWTLWGVEDGALGSPTL